MMNSKRLKDYSRFDAAAVLPSALRASVAPHGDYDCRRCGSSSASARERQHTVDTARAQIKRLKLCVSCWLQKQHIAREIEGCLKQWKARKGELLHDKTFLRNWRWLLLEHPDFGARKNTATIGMLNKLLDA